MSEAKLPGYPEFLHLKPAFVQRISLAKFTIITAVRYNTSEQVIHWCMYGVPRTVVDEEDIDP